MLPEKPQSRNSSVLKMSQNVQLLLFIFTAFGRCPYIYLTYKSEQLRFRGHAQGPNNDTLVVLGFELLTF